MTRVVFTLLGCITKPLVRNNWTVCRANRKFLRTSTKNYLPLPPAEEFEVSKFTATKSRVPLEINDEYSNLVVIEETLFCASASVILPEIPEGQHWRIGFIQALENCYSKYRYGDLDVINVTMPELQTGDYPMVNDSSGKVSPWYSLNSVVSVRGPKRKGITAKLLLNDEPGSVILTNSWYFLSNNLPLYHKICEFIPFRRLIGNVSFLPPKVEEAPLTFIAISNDFLTWLVVSCVHTGEKRILRTVKWSIDLYLTYDNEAEVNHKTTILAAAQDDPEVFERNHIPIPPTVFRPPIANEATAVEWEYTDKSRPKRLIQKPKCKPWLVEN